MDKQGEDEEPKKLWLLRSSAKERGSIVCDILKKILYHNLKLYLSFQKLCRDVLKMYV